MLSIKAQCSQGLLRSRNELCLDDSPDWLLFGNMIRYLKLSISLLLLGGAAWFALHDVDYSELLRSVTRFDITSLATVGAAIALSSIIASVRLRAIAADYGYHLSFRDSVAAMSLGQVGGALLLQLVGQLMARSTYLKRREIPVAGTVLITVQERIAAALVSATLAAIGALYLFQRITFDLIGGGQHLIVLLLGLFIASVTAMAIWRKELAALLSLVTLRATLLFARALVLSLGVQFAMMAAYVYAATVVAPEIGFFQLAGAAALVMFAASVPISFAGWGVREMSAVAAMSAIGMPADGALAIAVLIGLLSIAIASALALVSAQRAVSSPKSSAAVAAQRDMDGMLMSVLPVLVAVLVFFQVHLPTKAGGLNVNLADPLALLAGVLFILSSLRRGWPEWRIRSFGWMALACTAVMTLALLIGVSTIGWTQWAITNKYLGWFMLLAYGATGALAVRAGLQRVLRTFVVAGCAIVVYCILLSLTGYIWPLGDGKFPGFAQNPNAFAFQCLMVLAVALSLPSRHIVPALIAFLGIWLTGSRAGLGAGLVVLLVAVVLAGRAKLFRWSGASAAIAFTAFVAVSALIATACNVGGATAWCGYLGHADHIQLSSNSEHIISSLNALKMFWQNPVFGAGIGVFIHDSAVGGAHPLAIHSTLLWLLAEFGAFGAAIFLWPVLSMTVNELKRLDENDMAGRLLLLILVGFTTMSLVHELMYQRTLWFFIGAAMASPLLNHATSDASSKPHQPQRLAKDPAYNS